MMIVTYGVGGDKMQGIKKRGRLLWITSFYIVLITDFKNIIKSKRILKQPLKYVEKNRSFQLRITLTM